MADVAHLHAEIEWRQAEYDAERVAISFEYTLVYFFFFYYFSCLLLTFALQVAELTARATQAKAAQARAEDA